MASLLAFLVFQANVDAAPEELSRLRAVRESLISGEVKWSRTIHRCTPRREFRFISRYAKNGDIISEARGDDEGWVVVDSRGKGRSKFPELRMMTDEGLWSYQETSPTCDYWRHDGELGPEESNPPPKMAEFLDIRWIGTCASFDDAFARRAEAVGVPANEPGLQWIWKTERTDDDRVQITATAGEKTAVWVLNPARGWNVESTQITTPEMNVETTSQLANYSGVWFPENIDRYVNGELTESINILCAEFNQPNDPERFVPDDIGVEIGVNISPQNFRAHGNMLFWTGERLIDAFEYRNAVRAGELQPGPLMKFIREHGPEGSPYLTDEERETYAMMRQEQGFNFKPTHSDWERYVRNFIARYQLDSDQSQKALMILRDCQTKASAYLDRKKDEFSAAEKVLAASRNEQNRGAKTDAAETLRMLSLPIDEIFDNQLKPRLETLPTRVQRNRVDGHASSAPASRAADQSSGAKP